MLSPDAWAVRLECWQAPSNAPASLPFALVAECDQLEQVTPLVEELFTLLAKGDRLA